MNHETLSSNQIKPPRGKNFLSRTTTKNALQNFPWRISCDLIGQRQKSPCNHHIIFSILCTLMSKPVSTGNWFCTYFFFSQFLSGKVLRLLLESSRGTAAVSIYLIQSRSNDPHSCFRLPVFHKRHSNGNTNISAATYSVGKR